MNITNSEMAVLNIVINNPGEFFTARDSISANDFISPTAVTVWNAIVATNEAGQDTGLFQVRSRLTDDLAASLVGSFSGRSMGKSVKPYISSLKKETRHLNLMATVDQVSNERPEDAADVLDSAITDYRSSAESDYMTITDLAKSTFEYLESVNGGMVGVPTGLEMIDSKMGGLQGGRLVVIAARPSVGKTALAQQISIHAASQGFPVGTCSLEMSSYELGVRAMSHVYKVNVSKLFRAEEEALQMVSTGMMARNFNKFPMFFDCDTYELEDIASKIRLWAKRDNIKLAVVDHIGLVEVKGVLSPNERVGKVSRTLKKLAKELDIAIIAVSQLNRGNEKDNRMPILSDLRDSGSVEQDADIALFIHAQQGEDGQPPMYQLGLLKNRQGPRGWLQERVDFDGRIQTFIESDSSQDNPF